MTNISDSNYVKMLEENAKRLNEVSLSGMGLPFYKAPAGADKIIEKDSTTQGLDSIIKKITSGFNGEGQPGGEVTEPKKQEETEGNLPEIPKKQEETEGDMPPANREEFFDADEAEILNKLIQEIENLDVEDKGKEEIFEEFDDSLAADMIEGGVIDNIDVDNKKEDLLDLEIDLDDDLSDSDEEYVEDEDPTSDLKDYEVDWEE